MRVKSRSSVPSNFMKVMFGPIASPRHTEKSTPPPTDRARLVCDRCPSPCVSRACRPGRRGTHLGDRDSEQGCAAHRNLRARMSVQTCRLATPPPPWMYGVSHEAGPGNSVTKFVRNAAPRPPSALFSSLEVGERQRFEFEAEVRRQPVAYRAAGTDVRFSLADRACVETRNPCALLSVCDRGETPHDHQNNCQTACLRHRSSLLVKPGRRRCRPDGPLRCKRDAPKVLQQSVEFS